jgi:hypothetical protein
LRVLTIGEFMSEPPQIVTDPIEAAHRMAIRKIGEMLNERGGFNLMESACEKVDLKYDSSRPAVIIDHAWDGVGHWWA